MWRLLDARGAQFPAEHNFGHLYDAKPELIHHYKSLDPSNSFNPGIGRTRPSAQARLYSCQQESRTPIPPHKLPGT